MAQRKTNLKLEPLADILDATLKKRKIAVDREQCRLNGIWKQAAGPQIAAQSKAESLKNHVLQVKVNSSVWLQQLHFLKPEILGKLRPLLPSSELKDIRFSLATAPPPDSVRGRDTKLSLDHRYLKNRDKKMIEECRQGVKDPELGEIIARVMTKEILRRRVIEAQQRGKA